MALPSSFATQSWTSHRKVLTLALGLFSRSFAIFAPRTFFQSHYQVALKRSITNVLRCTKLTTAEQMPSTTRSPAGTTRDNCLVFLLRSTAGKCLGYVMVQIFLQIRALTDLQFTLFHSPSHNHAQCGWPWSIYHLVSILVAIASTLTTPACDAWLCERWHVQRGFVSSWCELLFSCINTQHAGCNCYVSFQSVLADLSVILHKVWRDWGRHIYLIHLWTRLAIAIHLT